MVSTTDDRPPQITVHHKHIPSPIPSAPSFAFQLTRLTSTLFIWVGTGSPSSGAGIIPGLDVDSGAEGTYGAVDKRLAAEWGVAMPSRGVSVRPSIARCL